MAETSNEGPLIPKETQRAVIALVYLFMYSTAMFTLPFIAFFGVRHILTDYYAVEVFTRTVWSVSAAVVMVNIIILLYAYKGYHEKEYDEHGNEIDQHSYKPVAEKSSLDLKED